MTEPTLELQKIRTLQLTGKLEEAAIYVTQVASQYTSLALQGGSKQEYYSTRAEKLTLLATKLQQGVDFTMSEIKNTLSTKEKTTKERADLTVKDLHIPEFPSIKDQFSEIGLEEFALKITHAGVEIGNSYHKGGLEEYQRADFINQVIIFIKGCAHQLNTTPQGKEKTTEILTHLTGELHKAYGR